METLVKDAISEQTASVEKLDMKDLVSQDLDLNEYQDMIKDYSGVEVPLDDIISAESISPDVLKQLESHEIEDSIDKFIAEFQMKEKVDTFKEDFTAHIGYTLQGKQPSLADLHRFTDEVDSLDLDGLEAALEVCGDKCKETQEYAFYVHLA